MPTAEQRINQPREAVPGVGESQRREHGTKQEKPFQDNGKHVDLKCFGKYCFLASGKTAQ